VRPQPEFTAALTNAKCPEEDIMFTKFFRFKQYASEDLATPLVLAWWQRFTIAIAAQATVDWIAWFFAMLYAMNSNVLAAVMATAIVVGVIQLDLSIITADDFEVNRWRKWGSLLFRIAFTIVIAGITAKPIELRWLEGEIENRLEKEQDAQIDAIREKAINTEKARIDAEATEVQTQLSNDASATVANADKDLNNYVSDRAAARTQMLESQAAKRASLEKQLKDKSDMAALEAAGKGPSGKYGNGPALETIRKQEAEAKEALDKFESEAATQVANFDQITQGKLVQLRAARDNATSAGQSQLKNRLDDLRKQRREKVEELRLMSPEKLAKLYGGSYKKSFGFLARYETLEKMREEKTEVDNVVWTCRVIMCVMGFLILGLAMSAPTEFKRYYSLGAQAAANDTYAKRVAEGMGYDDPKNFAMTVAARKALNDLFAARQELWLKVLELEKKIAGIVVADKKTGLYPTLLQIQGQLHSLWVQSGEEVLRKVGNYEEAVKRAGAKVPSWPTDKFGSDPRVGGIPVWKVDERKLRTFGWESPDAALTAAKQAALELTSHRLELRKQIETMEAALQELIAGNPSVSFNKVREHQFKGYREQIIPVLDKIRAAEDAMIRAGRDTPDWPEDFADPRSGLYQQLCVITESQLREKYDWKGVATPTPSLPVSA